MTVFKVYIGSTGPFTYDDTDSVNDVDGDFPGETQQAFLTNGTFGSIVASTSTFTNAGLKIEDTNASHVLTISPGSDLTGNKVLTITTGDASRTITLSGNPTLSDWFDQAVKAASSPTFANITDSGLTASLLVETNGSKQFSSVSKQAHIADASTGHTITDPADTPATVDALRDDLVLNTIPSLESALNTLGTKVNAILAAIETAKILNTA